MTQNSAGAGNKAMLDTRPVVDIDERERLSNAQRTLSAIRAASNALSSIHGRRKAIVMFSEGIDAAISNITAGAAQGEGTDMNVANLLPGAAGETQRDAEDAMAAAIKADVSIYGVDPGGLKGIGGAADITVPIEADPTAGMTLQSIDGELRLQLESLRRLSVNTGGFAAINTNDLGPSFDRIREDNSRYYLLGYYPTATKADGKYHRLDVKVLKPGLQVRARAGYLAARPGSNPSTSPADASSKIPPALRDVLDNPLPVPGVRLTASATRAGMPPEAPPITAVLLVDGRDIRFKEKDGRFDGQLTLSMLATDAEGKVKGSGARAISLPLRAGLVRPGFIERHPHRRSDRRTRRPVSTADRRHGRRQSADRIGALRREPHRTRADAVGHERPAHDVVDGWGHSDRTWSARGIAAQGAAWTADGVEDLQEQRGARRGGAGLRQGSRPPHRRHHHDPQEHRWVERLSQ